MAIYQKLTLAQARAYERFRDLERRRAAAELQYARARASARLATGVADSIDDTGSADEQEAKQAMQALASAAEALAGRAAAARRFSAFRSIRTWGSWKEPGA